MPDKASRSRSALAAGLTRWFEARHPDWSEVTVEVQRPQPGLSSDTLILEVTGATVREHYVARLPPAGPTVFPDYDLDRQARVQNAVGAHGVAAAPALAVETDVAWIGAPFLLMPRVAGHTLTTNPAYVLEGWLADQTPRRQAEVVETFLDLLASIHRLTPQALRLGPLTGGGPSLAGMLDYWQHFLEWATPNPEATAIHRGALEWCRTHLPTDPPEPSVLWGDPQLTNLVLDDDGGIAAALDFEMACYGPAELDLAWFLVLHEHGASTAGAELPGYPGRDAIIERYAAALGRPLADLEWYEVFANLRTGAIVVRIGALLERAGHSPSWTTLVPQHRFLAELIGA